jgi:hypothetical protein
VETSRKRLFVFSHPNHELAIFGLVGRLRPKLAFLTDGGGPDRVAQTRRGLESLDLLSEAELFDYREEQLYQALVERETALLAEIAARLGETIERERPEEIWCDAVELYNPVHDLALPIVRAAVGDRAGCSLFEVPLIYQLPGPQAGFSVQRFPPSMADGEIRTELTRSELEAKTAARDSVYTLLAEQLGSTLSGLPAGHLAVEVVRPTSGALSQPGGGRFLRYEQRGELLRQRGLVEQVITYEGHYLPTVRRLRAAA